MVEMGSWTSKGKLRKRVEELEGHLAFAWQQFDVVNPYLEVARVRFGPAWIAKAQRALGEALDDPHRVAYELPPEAEWASDLEAVAE
jgi:hypothetical protein